MLPPETTHTIFPVPARPLSAAAGALALAAAQTGRAGTGKVVCVVSGGNINLSKLADILNGATS